MVIRPLPILVSAAAFAGIGLLTESQAATLPYFENFDDETVGATAPSETSPESGAFTIVSPAGAWSVQAGSLTGDFSGNSYRNSFTTDSTNALALIDFDGSLGGSAATASDFALSVDFRFNTGTSTGPQFSTFGLAFLMSNAGSGYFVDVGVNGLLRIVEVGTVRSSFDQNTDAVTGLLSLGSVYTLTVSGTYVDTNSDLAKDQLNIVASMTGPGVTDPFTINFSDTTPLTDTYFGFRNRNNNPSDINVSLDNFSVAAVPEPATAGLLLAGAAGLGFRRRRGVAK